MAGIKAARKIQLGLESTSGTAVAATAVWRGEAADIDDTREIVEVEENVGYLGGTDRTHTTRLGAELTFPDTPATFEQLPYVLSAGVENIVAGSADGGGSGYIYQYDMPTTAQNTIKTYTIEAGNNQKAYEMEYAYVEEFTLSGKANEAWMLTGVKWVGRQKSASTFTGALALVAVEDALFNKTKLYIDAATGTLGNTLISAAILEASIKVKTGWKSCYFADGQLYFTNIKQTVPEIEIDLTFEHIAAADTQYANWTAQTALQMRLLCEGSALATAGTTYTYKTLRMDFAGKFLRFEPLDEQDGNDVYKAKFRARNSTASGVDVAFGQFLVVNEVSTLP